MCSSNKLTALFYMPAQSSFKHIPWRQRSRKQKVIIVTFLALVLFIMINVVGWVAYLCVVVNDKKYSGSEASDMNALLT